MTIFQDDDLTAQEEREWTEAERQGDELRDRYDTYRFHANDGKGGDITRPGQPLKSFQEWLMS